MATTLRDFIALREGEIKEGLKALKAELKELQVAKAALDGQPGAAPIGSPVPTIKDMARHVLAGQPGGLNSGGILDAIKKVFERDIERTSLSPQLSRLKEEGELVLDGEVWLTKFNWEARVAEGARLAEVERLLDDTPDPDLGRDDPMFDDDDDNNEIEVIRAEHHDL